MIKYEKSGLKPELSYMTFPVILLLLFASRRTWKCVAHGIGVDSMNIFFSGFLLYISLNHNDHILYGVLVQVHDTS